MRRILLLLLLLMPVMVMAQSAKISGVITDEKGNKLPFVSVAEKGTTNGTISDSEGNFIIKVKQVPATLLFNCVGFCAFEQTFNSSADKVNIKMEEETTELAEVQVVAKHGRSRTDNVIIGVENIQMSEMAKVPALMGERDVIKSIQLLPGIKSEGDGSCGFQVRGGTAAQNLILIDNAVIYNAGHLMGVFSTFNDEALTNASLYKGAIPAQFGDAIQKLTSNLKPKKRYLHSTKYQPLKLNQNEQERRFDRNSQQKQTGKCIAVVCCDSCNCSSEFFPIQRIPSGTDTRKIV